MARTFEGDFDTKNNRSLTIAELQQVIDVAKVMKDAGVMSPSVYLHDGRLLLAGADSMAPVADVWWNAEAELWLIDFGDPEPTP